MKLKPKSNHADKQWRIYAFMNLWWCWWWVTILALLFSYAYDRPGKHHHHPTPKQNNQWNSHTYTLNSIINTVYNGYTNYNATNPIEMFLRCRVPNAHRVPKNFHFILINSFIHAANRTKLCNKTSLNQFIVLRRFFIVILNKEKINYLHTIIAAIIRLNRMYFDWKEMIIV